MELNTLTENDRKERVRMLLHSTDEFIKVGNFEKALEVIRNVYQYDIKNMYARAFEERILAMIVERDGQLLRQKFDEKNKVIQKEIEQKAQIEVNKKLKEFYRQWEDESKRRESQEKQEVELELKAREAAFLERQKEFEKTYQDLLVESREKSGEMKKTEYNAEIQHNHEIHIEKVKEEYNKQIEEILKQSEENERVFSSRELLRFRWRSIEVYKSILMAMNDSSGERIESSELLIALRGILDITDEENIELIRSVKIDTYIKALRKAWENGKAGDEELKILTNLRIHYGISDEEHERLVRQVKKDLGIPDDNAMILLIDDSRDILVFCDYALRKTYKKVKTAISVEAALAIITTEMPSLIICDVMMPDVSGFQFYDNIKNGVYGVEIQNVPFMFMSACDDHYMKMIASTQGVTKYLAKPTTKEALENAVKEMLIEHETV